MIAAANKSPVVRIDKGGSLPESHKAVHRCAAFDIVPTNQSAGMFPLPVSPRQIEQVDQSTGEDQPALRLAGFRYLD